MELEITDGSHIDLLHFWLAMGLFQRKNSQEPISAVPYKVGVSPSHSLIVSPHIGQLLEVDLVYMQNAQPQSCPVCWHQPSFSYVSSVPGKQEIR